MQIKAQLFGQVFLFLFADEKVNQCPVGGRLLEFLPDDGNTSSFRRVLLTEHM